MRRRRAKRNGGPTVFCTKKMKWWGFIFSAPPFSPRTFHSLRRRNESPPGQQNKRPLHHFIVFAPHTASLHPRGFSVFAPDTPALHLLSPSFGAQPLHRRKS